MRTPHDEDDQQYEIIIGPYLYFWEPIGCCAYRIDDAGRNKEDTIIGMKLIGARDTPFQKS